MSKTPFEIRSDILQMTKDYMDRQWEANTELAQRLFEAGEKTAEEFQAMTEMYTPEELLKQAEEFYTNFVTKK